MSDLPNGWSSTSLGDLFEFKYGKGLVKNKRNATGSTEVYGSNGVVGKHDDAITQGPTIIIGRKGSVGEINFSSSACWPIDTTYYVDQFPCDFPPKYWALYLKWLRLGEREKSSAIPGISRDDIYSVEVWLPPLNEQRRIAAKLQKLLSRVDAAQARLATIPRILKRFRQSVLAAASSGKLTTDWRKEHLKKDRGSELVEAINRERRDDKRVEVLNSSEFPDEDIPETWSWTRFGSVIGEFRNGISTRPNMAPPGTPILRINAVRPGRVDLNEIRYLPNGEDLLAYALQARDLLFTRYNGSLELLGVCGMVRDLGQSVLLYPDKLMRVRFDHDFVLPEYVEIFFQAPAVHDRVIARSKSSAGQNGIAGSDIKAQAFALPPLAEQQEMVRRVNVLFKTADALEARYHKAKAHVDKLTQSILAKAFRGELIPQDPTDEPASVLLEKVHLERNCRETKK